MTYQSALYRRHKDNKLPGEILDYTIDWTNQLESGEDIVTSVWTVPAGITEDAEGETTKTATVWLSGGTAGQKYKLINTITTSTRTYSAYLTISVW